MTRNDALPPLLRFVEDRLTASAVGASRAFAVAVQSYVLSATFFPSLNPAVVPPPTLLKRFDLGSEGTFYEVCLVFLLVGMLVAHYLR